MIAAALAGAAGALGACAAIGLCTGAAGRNRPLLQAVARRAFEALTLILRPLRVAGARGVEPSERERLRLMAAACAGGLLIGALAFGAAAAVALAILAAWLASRSLVQRRVRYRRRVDAGTSSAAQALADALASGHSVRGALMVCGRALDGAVGAEFRSLAERLELGGETDHELERLRARCRSRRIDLIVAAVRLQRRSGGGLAGLLRGIAATIDEQDRLEDEARAASAQARFTSLLVLLLPVAGGMLGELASPGATGRMLASPVGRWLLAAALGLQATGMWLVRRLSGWIRERRAGVVSGCGGSRERRDPGYRIDERRTADARCSQADAGARSAQGSCDPSSDGRRLCAAPDCEHPLDAAAAARTLTAGEPRCETRSGGPARRPDSA